MVDRFDADSIMHSLDGIELKPTPNGAWVRYADVAALQPSGQTRGEIIEECAQIAESFDVHYSDPNTWATSFGRIAAAIRALAAPQGKG